MKKPRQNLEGRLQLAIIKMVRTLGYVCGKTKTVGIFREGRFSKDPYVFRGFPDLTMFVCILACIGLCGCCEHNEETKVYWTTCYKSDSNGDRIGIKAHCSTCGEVLYENWKRVEHE